VTFNLGSFAGGTGPYTVTVTWGDGTSSSFSAAAGALSAVHKYVNDQAAPYTVTVKVTDETVFQPRQLRCHGRERCAKVTVTAPTAAAPSRPVCR
jgi:hypothetical protein